MSLQFLVGSWQYSFFKLDANALLTANCQLQTDELPTKITNITA